MFNNSEESTRIWTFLPTAGFSVCVSALCAGTTKRQPSSFLVKVIQEDGAAGQRLEELGLI